jgi:hypothetical protein
MLGHSQERINVPREVEARHLTYILSLLDNSRCVSLKTMD